MAERNESHLLNGGDDPMGMTDNQYKGMLLDQLEDWQEILDLAIEAGNTEIQKKVEKQIAKSSLRLRRQSTRRFFIVSEKMTEPCP